MEVAGFMAVKRKTKAYIRRRKKRMRILCLMVVAICIITITGTMILLKRERISAEKPEIDVQLLTVNKYSRPGIKSDKINGIVVHYTANPGSTAKENRDYFESLKDGHDTSVSSHFVIGLEGEIIQCVPTWEFAYASNDRNHDTVSIECCHPDETGKFLKETYRSLVQLTGWLCIKFDLDTDDIIRHYDVTGKNCPKYFVEHEEEWIRFKEDVKKAIEKTDITEIE